MLIGQFVFCFTATSIITEWTILKDETDEVFFLSSGSTIWTWFRLSKNYPRRIQDPQRRRYASRGCNSWRFNWCSGGKPSVHTMLVSAQQNRSNFNRGTKKIQNWKIIQFFYVHEDKIALSVMFIAHSNWSMFLFLSGTRHNLQDTSLRANICPS